MSFAGTPIPTDSSSSIIDQTAALLIIDEGKTLYNAGKVRDALLKFREAAIKDPYSYKAVLWQGQCHYRLNAFGIALSYGNKAIKLGKDNTDKEVYELLGRSYHRMGDLDSAIINYQIALDKLSASRAKELSIPLRIEQCKFAKEQIASGKSTKRTRLEGDINSSYGDYNAILMNEGKEIYFTSRRSDTKGGQMNPDDQEFFEDVYRAVWDDELKMWDSISNDLGKLNSDGFDALTYLSDNGMFGIMTINQTYTTGKKKPTMGSDLFEIERAETGNWNSPKRINNKTINTSYFEGSATVTADGNTMYFVSDRKGETSSTDIYMVERNGKKWGTAKPLPMNKINTVGNETTPYISADGRYLFYSSNGLIGMGGLDIYVVENLGGGEWGTPVNLGIMVNTVNNDSHFKYNPLWKKALMTSFEVTGNKASLDIYEVDMTGFEYPKK